MSLDGFIADKEGGYDWITGDGDSSHDTSHQMVFQNFVAQVDTLVMGHRTFKETGKETRHNFPNQKILVASSQPLSFKMLNVEWISGDIVKHVLKLKESPGKDIWIFGGGILADQFIKANVIDEFYIGVVPIILGNGIKLFLDKNPRINLHLEDHSIRDGLITLRYSKKKL